MILSPSRRFWTSTSPFQFFNVRSESHWHPIPIQNGKTDHRIRRKSARCTHDRIAINTLRGCARNHLSLTGDASSDLSNVTDQFRFHRSGVPSIEANVSVTPVECSSLCLVSTTPPEKSSSGVVSMTTSGPFSSVTSPSGSVTVTSTSWLYFAINCACFGFSVYLNTDGRARFPGAHDCDGFILFRGAVTTDCHAYPSRTHRDVPSRTKPINAQHGNRFILPRFKKNASGNFPQKPPARSIRFRNQIDFDNLSV